MPSCVLFDVMGTITHDPFYDEVPAFFGMSMEQLLAEKHPTSWVEWELGEIDEAEFRGRFFADGRDYDFDGLKATYRAAFRFLPGMEELMGELQARGVEQHLLSNYTTWYQLIEESLRLSRFAAWSCVSCDLGARKPDPQIYRRALERIGRRAEDCVFIDDREVNCAGAEAVGIRSLRFRDGAALRAELLPLLES